MVMPTISLLSCYYYDITVELITVMIVIIISVIIIIAIVGDIIIIIIIDVIIVTILVIIVVAASINRTGFVLCAVLLLLCLTSRLINRFITLFDNTF